MQQIFTVCCPSILLALRTLFLQASKSNLKENGIQSITMENLTIKIPFSF